MNKNNIKENPVNTWDKMVHTLFKKIVQFDLICIGPGIVMGIGIGHLLSRKDLEYKKTKIGLVNTHHGKKVIIQNII